MHHRVLPQTEAQTGSIRACREKSSWRFTLSLFPHLVDHPQAPEPRGSAPFRRIWSPFITIAREHDLLSPCRDAPYYGGSKQAARPTLRRAAPLFPLPSPAAGHTRATPEPPRACLAHASARRAPWPTTDGADVHLSPLPPPTKRSPPQQPLTPSDHMDMPSPP